MFRRTPQSLVEHGVTNARNRHVKSHQIDSIGHTFRSPRLGRSYTSAWIKFGYGGWGMGTHGTGKFRRFHAQRLHHAVASPQEPGGPMVTTTRTLSPEWRAFALADGGVLFTHPSSKQVMEWGQKTLQRENEAIGQADFDRHVNCKIQSLMADATLESVPLSEWRRAHMWQLIRNHGKHSATPSAEASSGSNTS